MSDNESPSSASVPDEVPQEVHGIDFSGGRSAGKRTWIASGAMEDGSLKIDDCRTASKLPGSGTQRDKFLDALVDWIADQGFAAFGLDFPFSMPAELIEEDTWEAFVRAFPKKHDSADHFRMACQRKVPGEEITRGTDKEKETPFSPYNLRLYKETYHGIANVLAPLVEDDSVCVLPMQEPEVGKPWIFEVSPASTMKSSGQRQQYKGSTQEHRAARTQILKQMQGAGKLTIRAQGVLSSVLRDSDGDALHSVIGAHMVTQVLLHAEDKLIPDEPHGDIIEGHVYA
jgi:hypothetical protein